MYACVFGAQVNHLNTLGQSGVKATEVALRCRLLNVILGHMQFPNLQLLAGPFEGDLFWMKHVSADWAGSGV